MSSTGSATIKDRSTDRQKETKRETEIRSGLKTQLFRTAYNEQHSYMSRISAVDSPATNVAIYRVAK